VPEAGTLMAAYRYSYPLPRRYSRVRYPYRYRPLRLGKGSGTVPGWVIAAAALLIAGAGTKAVTAQVPAHAKAPAKAEAAAGNAVAAEVIAYARERVGKVPYLYGGTTDQGIDCSALAMKAWAAAGVTIKRTSEQQWASERHVPASEVVPGDLAFFAGSDGTPTSPGHVGIVVGKNRIIDAFAAGTYVRYDGTGPAASPGTGLADVVGFTDPAPVPVPAPPAPAPAAGGSEGAFMGAVLADVSAPGTAANVSSLEAWANHEGPWGTVGRWNPLDTTLTEPGAWAFNTLPGGGHVWNYPNAAEGAQATAATLLGGSYPSIVAALRAGTGICGGGYTVPLSLWSGGGYQEAC